jgi:hypothetical protein
MTMRYALQIGLVSLLAISAACSSNSNPLSPSATPGVGNVAAVPEGTPTLKASTPGSPSPASGSTTELGPQNTIPVTLSVANAVATHANAVALGHRFQLFEGTALVAEPLMPAGTGRTSWTVTAQLKFDTVYTWRVRAELADAYGQWSPSWTFRTPVEPPVAATLPFTIPASCGPVPNPTSNRIQCAQDVARVSPEWGRCQGGSGVGCHRFTRHVAASLAAGDPAWGLIGKAPGEQQCTWNRCGGLSGEGYGEDVVAYLTGPNRFSNWTGFDIVAGAGAPGASVSWGGPLPRRSTNFWTPLPTPIER